MAKVDLKLLLEDLLLGGLRVREKPTLLFIVVTIITISVAVGGMGGAHRMKGGSQTQIEGSRRCELSMMES